MILRETDAAALARDELERRRTGKTRADQAEALRGNFLWFIEAAWPLIIPGRYIPTWHIGSIAEHYQAAVEREILRLLITIQPRIAKSSIVSVLGPAWAWTRNPAEKILSASHGDDLSTRDTTRSRQLMQTEWYTSLFLANKEWAFTSDMNLKTRYTNTKGGHRIRTHVGGGRGEGGTILELDDPHDGDEVNSENQLHAAWEWWGDTWVSRLDDTTEERGVMIVVGQRVAPGDLIGRLLMGDQAGERWTHLCLPTEYDPDHPYVTPAKRKLPSGRTIQGDVRTRAGELIAPDYQSHELLADRTHDMVESTRQAQYQQRPAPKEGFLLKRGNWRYYDPNHGFYGKERLTRARAIEDLPGFRLIVCSWDTSVKDRASSDFVSGQCWAVPRERPADRWLLRLFHKRAGLNETIEAMLTLHEWAADVWPDVRLHTLVENTANGPDAIREIRGRLQGVQVYEARGSKYQRAEAASPALDGHNCFLPGYALPTNDGYDAATHDDIQRFVEETAVFRGTPGERDDQVDAWSQMVNWTRSKARGKGKITRPRGIVPSPAGLPQ